MLREGTAPLQDRGSQVKAGALQLRGGRPTATVQSVFHLGWTKHL